MDPATVSEAVGRQDGHASTDEYSGLDQTISQFCLALKTKLVKAPDHPKNVLPIASVGVIERTFRSYELDQYPQIKSLEEELFSVVVLCRRMINHHDSAIHSLPPEILATVASHLDDNGSLITATHVCHRWRSTFLSFPHLWSYVVFSNTQCALAFLKRSKSIPVSAHLPGDKRPSEAVKESLKSIAGRLIGLSGSYNRFLGEFLTQPLPLLRDLELIGCRNLPPLSQSVSALPSVRSLTTRGLDYPPRSPLKNLTNFRFELKFSFGIPSAFGDTLLEFLRSCPLLEVVHFGYGPRDCDIGSSISSSTETVSLPCLRSFTHDSPFDKVDIALFDRLSVPPTCDLAFTIVPRIRTPSDVRRWTHGFPIPRNRSHISDIKTVKVMADFQDAHTLLPTFRTEFFNSKGARISFAFTRVSDPHSSAIFVRLLDFLENREITHSVEVLRLESLHEGLPINLTNHLMKFDNLKTLILWQCKLDPFLSNLPPSAVWCRAVQQLVVCPLPPRGYWNEAVDLGIVRDLAIERQRHGIPLETVTMLSRDIECLSREYRREIDEVKSCVGSMEVIRLGD